MKTVVASPTMRPAASPLTTNRARWERGPGGITARPSARGPRPRAMRILRGNLKNRPVQERCRRSNPIGRPPRRQVAQPPRPSTMTSAARTAATSQGPDDLPPPRPGRTTAAVSPFRLLDDGLGLAFWLGDAVPGVGVGEALGVGVTAGLRVVVGAAVRVGAGVAAALGGCGRDCVGA